MAEVSPEHPDGARQPSVGNGGHPERTYFRGVAPVPQRPVPAADDTGDLPPATVSGSGRGGGAGRWRRGEVGADAPPGGRWRSLRRGAGWTAAGLWFAVICWGMWAASRREDLVGSALAIGLVLTIAALVFSVSRLLGRVVLEGTMGRQRHTAWPSHLATFLLLVIGGVAFLQQTWWLVDAWRWLTDQLLA